MRYLLDTCTFLWLNSETDRIPERVLSDLASLENDLYLSSASAWEISAEWSAGRIVLPEHPSIYVPTRRRLSGVAPLPITEEALMQAVNLPPVHADLLDRILVCQAIVEGLTLVSPDPVLRQYPVRVHW